MGSLPYKILACPIRQGAQHVVGLLMLLQAARRHRLRHAPGARARDDDAPHRVRAAECLRPEHRPADASGVRAARARGARCRRRRRRALHRLRRRRSAARDQREPRHARRRRGRSCASPRRSARSCPHNVFAARISGDRFALFFAERKPRGRAHVPRQPVRGDQRARLRATKARRSRCRRASASRPSRARSFRCRTRSLHAEAACKAAKDRGRGRVELYQDADRSIVRRYEDVAIIGDLREAIANDRFRMEAQPIVELAHTGGARRFELLLRMIDAVGRERRARQVPHGRRALPARDRHRSLGRAVRARDPVVGRAAAGEHGRALRDQHLRPVARRRAVPDLPRAEAARVRPAGRHAVVRDHRDRGGRQHRARRDAHPSPAGSGPLRSRSTISAAACRRSRT